MKILRLLALVAVVLAAYFAQYLLDYRTFEQLFLNSSIGNRVQAAIPALLYSSPNDLIVFALWLFFISAIGFGLLVPQWNRAAPTTLSPQANLLRLTDKKHQRNLWLPLSYFTLAVVSALYSLIYMSLGSRESYFLQILWGVGLIFYLVGSFLSDRSSQPKSKSPQLAIILSNIQPYRSWPTLLLIALAAGSLFAWQLVRIPVRIDEQVAVIGLQSLAVGLGNEGRLFALGWDNVPFLAYLPAAFTLWLTRDPLLGIRAIGPIMGLLLVVATWLLGCELFRRTPYYTLSNRTVRDDGRSLALLAAALMSVGYTMIHFSRMPFYLTPVAGGTLAAWCLLRGLRLNQQLLLALSGLLTGLLLMLYQNSLSLFLLLWLWWGCLLLLKRNWLFKQTGGVGIVGFLVWFGGILVAASPFVGIWIENIDTLYRYVQSDTLFVPALQSSGQEISLQMRYLTNLSQTLLTFNLYPDNSALFGYPSHLLNSLFAPLFILGVGSLFFNLNRLLGWLLLSWFATVLVGSAMSLDAPFWPRLLPALPVIAYIMAFAIDRIHTVLLSIIGLWMRNILLLATIGLLLWGATQNWVNYHEFATGEEDFNSYVGWVLYKSRENRPNLFFINVENRNDNFSNAERQNVSTFDGPLFEFLSNHLLDDRESATTIQMIQPNEWPERLPPDSWLLIKTSASFLFPEIQQRYPGGTFHTERSQQANPVLFVYQLP